MNDVQPLDSNQGSNTPAPFTVSRSESPVLQYLSKEKIAYYGKDLSVEQRGILNIVAQGQSVFFTGAAGTGKSVTLRSIIAMLKFKYANILQALAVTASTGIAALNIGGHTLHGFAGIGLGKRSLRDLIWMVKNNINIEYGWRTVQTLIIDEISMVNGHFFDKLEILARVLRRSNRPFGGIQLIICGDFFQLPPVPDQYMGAPVSSSFAFDALSWRRCIKHQMRLTTVFRQADSGFVNLLNRMRVGQVDQDMVDTILSLGRDLEDNGIQPVEIYPLNAQVVSANSRKLDELSGPIFSHEAKDGGRKLENEAKDLQAVRISKLLDKYSIAPRHIQLKKGAQVMLIRNIIQGTLVNGSLGRVKCFATCAEARKRGILTGNALLERTLEAQAKLDGKSLTELRRVQQVPDEVGGAWPVVEFTNKHSVLFTPLPFDTEDVFGDLVAAREQVPLTLGWAISIHKSQGQTIEKLKIDFDGTFESGQAYVAMSRSTGLSTLQVVNFNPAMVRAHPRVIAWYKNLLVEEEMDNEEAVNTYYSHD